MKDKGKYEISSCADCRHLNKDFPYLKEHGLKQWQKKKKKKKSIFLKLIKIPSDGIRKIKSKVLFSSWTVVFCIPNTQIPEHIPLQVFFLNCHHIREDYNYDNF
jgi:hypothetical protein